MARMASMASMGKLPFPKSRRPLRGTFLRRMASFLTARAVVSVAMVVGCAATAACSLVLKAEGQQCNTDDDCAARGASFAGTRCVQQVCVGDNSAGGSVGGAGTAGAGGAGGPGGTAGSGANTEPRWACLGKVPPPVAGAEPVDVAVAVQDDASTPVTNLVGRVCTNLDINCLSPYKEGLVADAGGIFRFQVPPTFVGYLELEDGRFKDGGAGGASGAAGTGGAAGNPPNKLVPVLVVIDALTNNVPVANEPITMVSYGLVDVLASIFAQKFDPTRATTLVAIYDCDGRRASDVSLEVDPASAFPETTVFYTIGPPPGVPDPTVAFTDVNGTGGVLNMKPKVNAVVVARTFQGGQRLGSITFPTRAGWMSNSNIQPSP